MDHAPRRVAVATIEGRPNDPHTWSGVPAKALRELSAVPELEIVPVGPVAWLPHRLIKLVGSITWRTRVGRLAWEAEHWFVRGVLTRSLRRRIRRAGRIDVVLTMGWVPLAADGLPPVVFWGDATNAQRIDVAPNWTNLSSRSRRQVEAVEGAALRSVADVVMASSWAADDVHERYGIPAERIHRIPLAADLEPAEPIARTLAPPLHLLVVGVQWERKGMDVAVAVAEELLRRGHDVRLDLVGADPPAGTVLPDFAHVQPRLSKGDPAELALLRSFFERATVLLHPARHDPSPVVVAEAAAHSLPVVASRREGLIERVADGRSGVLVDPHGDPSDYADAVEDIVRDPATYAGFASRSREHFEATFSNAAMRSNLAAVLLGAARSTDGGHP